MSTRKHNEFLDADESEGEQSQGYDSENDDLQKGGRSVKRRKVDSDVSDNDDDHSDHEIEDNEEPEERKNDEDEEAEVKTKTKKTDRSELPGVSKPLTKKNLVATEAAIKKSGVVYLSRIPPFMKPTKLRSLLEPYGSINRIFLTPEDPTSHSKRVRNGGNKKKSFVDGWVEFTNKVQAKHACELLNAQIIGGKKGTYYHDDVWNLVYLKGFKWNNLTEQIAAENAERASRMRAEISKTTKENKEFVQNVERAKMLETMEAKKVAKKRKDEDSAAGGTNTAEVSVSKKAERPRHFKQTAVATKKKLEDQPDQVKRVLSKIF